MQNKRKVGASILSFNSSIEVLNLVEKLLLQDLENLDFHIDIIDSSTDLSTFNIITSEISNFDNISLHSIRNSDFSHGGTRQLAIERSIKRNEEILIFIVQDAIPVSNDFIKNHINLHDSNSKIAIVFGKQVPYKNHGILVKGTIESVFKSLSPNDNIVLHSNNSPNIGTYFNSNVNASYKTVYFANDQLKFEELQYAEDQQIAKLVIDSGLIKAYCPKCSVFHSHDYKGFIDNFQRLYDDFNGVDDSVGHPGDHVNIFTFIPKFFSFLRFNYSIIRTTKDHIFYKFREFFWAIGLAYARVLALYFTLTIKNTLAKNLYYNLLPYLSREFRIKNDHNLFSFRFKFIFYILITCLPFILPILVLLKNIKNYILRKLYKNKVENQDINFADPLFSFIDRYYFDISSIENQISKNSEVDCISWLIPDFNIGGGGHMIIFFMAKELEKNGIKSIFYIYPPFNWHDSQKAMQIIQTHYVKLEFAEINYLNVESQTRIVSNILLVSDWGSIFYSKLLYGHNLTVHFVQDLEPYFFPRGSKYLLAEIAFREVKHFISNSKWLHQVMINDYNKVGYHIDLGYDQNVYKCLNEWDEREFAIAFYSRDFTERRAVKLGIIILSQLIKLLPNIKVYFYGDNRDLTDGKAQFVHCGILSYDELSALYNRCKIGIVFSATNYSIIPQEMNACGLPVIDIDFDGNALNYSDRSAVVLLPLNLNLMVHKLLELLSDDSKLMALSKLGLKEVSKFTWDKAGNSFYEALMKLSQSQN
jgi:hypothetical protein